MGKEGERIGKGDADVINLIGDKSISSEGCRLRGGGLWRKEKVEKSVLG